MVVFKNLIIISLALVLFAGFSSSCKKKDSLAVVEVIDTVGRAMAGAKVQIFVAPTTQKQLEEYRLKNCPGNPTCFPTINEEWNMEQVANGQGVAEFDYSEMYHRGSAGLSQLVVVASLGTQISDTVPIKLEEYKTVTQTATIK